MPKLIIGVIIGSLVLIFGLFTYLTADDPEKYLIFGTWGTPQEIESFENLINLYNTTRSPAHKVKLFHPENISYDQRLLIQAAAGNLPDVMHLHNQNLQSLVHKGLIEDLTPFVEADTTFQLGAFFPNLVQSCVIDERLYAIPHNFSTLVLYYNKDHFDAEGIPYPDTTWTWDTIVDVAKKLTRRDATGKIVRYGVNIHIILFTLMYQNGAEFLNETLDSCIIGSPEAAEALQFQIDLSEKHKVSWSSLATGIQWDDMFAGGRCSMLTNGRWAAAWYVKYMPPKSMDIAPLPRGKFRVGGIASHMMGMSSQSKKKKEAWEFIKFLVAREGQIMVSDDGNNIPALREIAESDLFLKNKNTPFLTNKVFLEELPHAVDWAFNPGPYLTPYPIVQLMTVAEKEVLLKRSTSLKALKKMEAELNKIIQNQKRVPETKEFFGSFMFSILFIISLSVVFVLVRYRGKIFSRAPKIEQGVSPR